MDVSGIVMLIPVKNNMKKILIENRIYIGIGLIVLVFGLLLFWPTKNKTAEVTKEKETKIVGMVQRSESVDWDKTEINIPEKMPILKAKNSFINGDKLAILLETLGMKDATVTQSDSNYVIYKNDVSTLYIKLKEKQIDFQIRSKLSYTGIKDATKAKENLKKVLDQISDRKIGPMNTEYFKDEFRAIRTSMAAADFLEITTNFLYEDRPIFSHIGGPSVKAQYNFDGKLGRLIIFNPFDELENIETVKLVTIDDIKNTQASKFPIFNIKGNREFELSTREDLINMIKGESSQLGYIYEPSSEKYVPFLIVNGKTTITSGSAEVTFGVPIVKQ
jgi:hypothetical protein